MDLSAPPEEMDAVFQAMASGVRRGVLDLLAGAQATVGELAAQLPVTRGAVSQHLKVLLAAGLVEVRPSGRERVYRLCGRGCAQMAAFANRYAGPGAAPREQTGAGAGVRRGVRSRADGEPAAAATPASGDADPVGEALARWQTDASHIDYGAVALLLYLDQIGQSVFKSTSDAAATAGMSYQELMVLGALRRVGAPYESTLTELSGMFWISLPGMMKRLARLEALGYLTRERNPRDRRSQHVRMTASGLAALRDLVANHQPVEYFALLALPGHERKLLSAMLPRLLKHIDRLHAHARPAYIVR